MNLRYESLASYDKPMVLLTQALDGEMTARGAMQTLVDADGLSPSERDSLVDRLKDRIGRNAVTDTAVDILTNPFVLLMAVTSPVGGSMLARSGKAVFDMGARFHPFVKEQGGLHAALGLLAPQQMFRGTALTPATQAFAKGVDQLEKQLLERVGEPLREVLEKHGLDSLNPEKVADPAKKALAKRLNMALWASLEGFDKARTEMIPAYKKGRMGFIKRDLPAYLATDMDAEIGRLGLTRLRDSYRAATAERRMAMFGDAAASAKAGKFVPDEDKLVRMVQGVRMGMQGKGAMSGTGAEVAAIMLGPDVAQRIAKGQLDVNDAKEFLKQIIENQPADYMPRNVIDVKGGGAMMDIVEQRRSRALVATGSSLSRSSVAGTWDPDDLRELYGMFGPTADGSKLLSKAVNRVQRMTARGESARVYRINAQESLARYFRDTGVTHALYVQTLDELPRVNEAVNSSLKMANAAKVKELDAARLKSPLVSAKKSLAEVFFDQHYLLEDRFAKEALETILRQAVGVQKVEHTASHMALIKGKQALGAVLDSGVGDALKGAGQWGQGVHSRLKGMVDAELSFGEAKGVTGTLAKYLYVTHLGLNLSSVAMNLMQPLLYTSVYGGLGNVMKAYGAAFKEMGGYVADRVGTHGFRALGDLEHEALINKHFKFSNVDGENLIQIGRDTFSTLDTISHKSEALSGVARRQSYFFDYPMKLFEKAEWLNRSVAAHSVENLYQSAGVATKPGTGGYYRMLNDVDEMVSATQFGGSTVNTPMMFQGVGPFGRAFNNPLMRQFLTFPLRSATALTKDSRMLGDRGWGGMGIDFIRGMGISAMFYEFGKNAFGVDLSPSLYGASLGQAAGGSRFFQTGNEWIPIPPIVDIPINMVRGALDPGQRALLQDNLPRLLPGGVATARLMNMMGDMPNSPVFGLPGSLQKTYIDPKQQTEDGRIAVFKGDGTLIDYQSKGQIFARALGVDLGTFKESSDFDGMLLKNRDQIVEYRRRAIAALLANDIPKMQSVQAEFERRFKMKLTVSKDQLDEAMQNRLVSRSERILDRMPPDLRPQYLEMSRQRSPQMGLEEEALAGADTARQRMQARRVEALPLSQEQQQAAAAAQPFEPFGGY